MFDLEVERGPEVRPTLLAGDFAEFVHDAEGEIEAGGLGEAAYFSGQGQATLGEGAGGVDQAGFYDGVADVVIVIGKRREDLAA